MIRPVTLLAALLAMVSGAYLFAVKHRAQVLDDQLAAVTEQSRLDGQRIRVLQAQWALEIDPTRLTQLATQFTTLQPMKPAQLVTVAALRDMLPPPGSPAPGDNPESLGQPDEAAYDTVIADNGLPLPPPAAPPAVPAAMAMAAFAPAAVAAVPLPAGNGLAASAQTASTDQTGAAPAALLAASIVHAAAAPPRPAAHRVTHQPVQLAESAPAPSIGAAYSAYQPSRSLPAVAVPAAAVVAAPQAVATPAGSAGSMLGMAEGNLPPPQPLGAN